MKLRPGREVHHVVLVDPRRAAQQRDRVHLLGLRLVLDQLHQVVAVDDLAPGSPRGCGPPRTALVSTCRGRPSLCTRSSTKLRAPLARLVPAGLERPLERGRVGRQEVGRRERRRASARWPAPPCAPSRRPGPRRRRRPGRTGSQPGSSAGARRTAGSRSTPGRRTGGPWGRPAPAAPPPGPSTARSWRAGRGRGRPRAAAPPARGRSGGPAAGPQHLGQRLAEPGGVQVLEQVGLRAPARSPRARRPPGASRTGPTAIPRW